MWRNRAVRAVIPLLVVVLAAPATVLTASAAGASNDRPDADFQVGAAAVDVTPPLAGPGVVAPPPCPGPAGSTGHQLLPLEEPYQDTNGNGRRDDGEPFQDCPVRRVDGTVAPPDGRWDGIYLGGGDCCDRQPTA